MGNLDCVCGHEASSHDFSYNLFAPVGIKCGGCRPGCDCQSFRPAGHKTHTYELAVTNQPANTYWGDRIYKIVQIERSTNMSPRMIVESYELDPGFRAVGLIDRTIGDILLEDWRGIK